VPVRSPQLIRHQLSAPPTPKLWSNLAQLWSNSFPTFLSSYAMSPSESSHTPPLGATIHQLKIKTVFNTLDKREKFYAHYLARAAWHGSRIVMRQVSPESPDIFDFIMDLYHACNGEWKTLVAQCKITSEELASFLEYAAMFLCNLGNFYVSWASYCGLWCWSWPGWRRPEVCPWFNGRSSQEDCRYLIKDESWPEQDYRPVVSNSTVQPWIS